MSGFRVGFDLHPLTDQADAKDWMLVVNGWDIWRLSDEELNDLSALILLKRAHAKAMANQHRDAMAVPFAEWAAELDEHRLALMGEPF